MGNAGASWKVRREAMGKTLGEASQALRISNRYLRGIEEGNYEGWPERVFSSGFIRSYAKYLSVDPAAVLAEYERTLETVSVEEPPPPQPRPEWLERERERGSRRTTYLFAAAAVLLVGVVLAFFTMRGQEGPAPPPPAAVEEPPAQPAPVPDNVAVAPAPVAAEAADNTAPAPAGTVSTVGGGGPLTGPFQLFLEASEHTWLMYSFDGGDPIDVTLYVGDKISIQAKSSITLKIGNAGGVVGTLNGQRLPPFGSSGQVREVTYP